MALRRLGPMGIARGKAQNAALPEPGRQPVDQYGNALRLGRGLSGDVRLDRIERIGARHAKHHGIEAETGIERVGQGFDPLAKQPHDPRRIAARHTGIDAQAPPCAVGALQPDDKAPATQTTLLHLPRQLRQQGLDNVEHILGAPDRFGKADLCA